MKTKSLVTLKRTRRRIIKMDAVVKAKVKKLLGARTT
jgi:hypothetical protein